ncbi:MAG: recombinase family protein [Dehalococcoidia bacterium]
MFSCGYFCDSGDPGSLARQNQEFLDYCTAQGYDVNATFFDREGERSGFLRLIEYLRPAEATPSRASERPATPRGFALAVIPRAAALGPNNEVAAASYYALKETGARVVVLNMDCFEGEQWPAGDSGLQEKMIGDRVRAAMRKRALKGEVLGRPPFGYQRGRFRRLEPVGDEAEVVRYIFRLYLREGLGVRLIARKLNENGFRTRSGKLWTMVSVRDILRNRVYLGNYNRLGVKVPGSHPKLIAEDEFKRVQELLSSRRSSPVSREAGSFLLAGLLTCAECGNHMIGVSRKQSWKRKTDDSRQEVTYRYYQCQSRTNQGVCKYHTRRADELEEALRRALAGEEPDGITIRTSRAGDDSAVRRTVSSELAEVDARLKVTDARIGRALAAGRTRAGGSDGPLLRELSTDRIDLELKRAEMARTAALQLSEDERRESMRKRLGDAVTRWDSLPINEARTVLNEAVEDIKVDDTRIEVTLY